MIILHVAELRRIPNDRNWQNESYRAIRKQACLSSGSRCKRSGKSAGWFRGMLRCGPRKTDPLGPWSAQYVFFLSIKGCYAKLRFGCVQRWVKKLNLTLEFYRTVYSAVISQEGATPPPRGGPWGGGEHANSDMIAHSPEKTIFGWGENSWGGFLTHKSPQLFLVGKNVTSSILFSPT